MWTSSAPCGREAWHRVDKKRRTEKNTVYGFLHAIGEDCEECARALLPQGMSPTVQSESGKYDAYDWAV